MRRCRLHSMAWKSLTDGNLFFYLHDDILYWHLFLSKFSFIALTTMVLGEGFLLVSQPWSVFAEVCFSEIGVAENFKVRAEEMEWDVMASVARLVGSSGTLNLKMSCNIVSRLNAFVSLISSEHSASHRKASFCKKIT